MAKHRENPVCFSCHGIMDPLGFALENFDAIGAWREKDRESLDAIDGSAALAGGHPVKGPDELRAWLAARPQQLVPGGDLDEAGDVAAGTDVELDVRHLHADDLVVVLLEAGALLDGLGRPLVEGDDRSEEHTSELQSH